MGDDLASCTWFQNLSSAAKEFWLQFHGQLRRRYPSRQCLPRSLLFSSVVSSYILIIRASVLPLLPRRIYNNNSINHRINYIINYSINYSTDSSIKYSINVNSFFSPATSIFIPDHDHLRRLRAQMGKGREMSLILVLFVRGA